MARSPEKRDFEQAMYSVMSNPRERARSKRKPLDLTINSPDNIENLVSRDADARFLEKFKFQDIRW